MSSIVYRETLLRGKEIFFTTKTSLWTKTLSPVLVSVRTMVRYRLGTGASLVCTHTYVSTVFDMYVCMYCAPREPIPVVLAELMPMAETETRPASIISTSWHERARAGRWRYPINTNIIDGTANQILLLMVRWHQRRRRGRGRAIPDPGRGGWR